MQDSLEKIPRKLSSQLVKVTMPVANHAFPAYFTLRYVKHKDICIFKLPSRNGEFYKQWEDDLVSELSKCLETDDNLKRRIYSRDINFCER